MGRIHAAFARPDSEDSNFGTTNLGPFLFATASVLLTTPAKAADVATVTGILRGPRLPPAQNAEYSQQGQQQHAAVETRGSLD